MNKPTPNTSAQLQCFATELRALELCLIESIELQQLEPAFRRNAPVGRLMAALVEELREHPARKLGELAASSASGAEYKSTIASMASVYHGFTGKMRPRQLTGMLRDDYALLHLLAITYAIFHRAALTLGNHTAAAMALTNLKIFTAYAHEINQLMPELVTEEMAIAAAFSAKPRGQPASPGSLVPWFGGSPVGLSASS